MENTSALTRWKTATKTLIRRGLRMVCRLDADGRLILYTTEFPPSWGYEQRSAYFNLTLRVMPLLAAQFERKRKATTVEGSFFASLDKTIKATLLPDGEMREYDSASLPPQPGHWPRAMWDGLRHWYCPRCGGSYWWIGTDGCGRNEDGVPCVSCCVCIPPSPGQAIACGRGVELDGERRVSTQGIGKLDGERREPVPTVKGEWTPGYIRRAETRAWVAAAAIAPTPERAWRLTPPEVRRKLLAQGKSYRDSTGRRLGPLTSWERPRG